jgi:stalled ribosome rescue protein Dom34
MRIDAEKANAMSDHYHALVWIDHREARIFHLSRTAVDQSVLHPDHPTEHIHHKANSIGSGHAHEDQKFFRAVTEAVSGSGAILITGPANAKAELVKHIHVLSENHIRTLPSSARKSGLASWLVMQPCQDGNSDNGTRPSDCSTQGCIFL